MPPKGHESIRTDSKILSHQIYNYPKNAVIYYVNGKKIKDEDKLRKIVDAHAQEITKITTDAVRKDGTRIIRIDFSKTQPGANEE